ncbi:enoyl-CoA delta isomerase 2 [Anopheles aquasalis]|uniref:enoyl-CoA delta isomerase 2 n=1 Tax=Anopheles aquasalis TaxID=42839 RepID=UPI00215A0EF9|nr:enoyl-CoA delta isomerase 2 [Anopheles aquasalis]
MANSAKQPAHLKLERFGTVLRVTINNPSKKNALNRQAYKDVCDTLNAANRDDTVNVVVLTGTGDFYSSGNDISSIIAEDGPAEEKLAKGNAILRDMVRAFINFDKLLIGIVNGPAIGIAATTVLLCDVVYMVDTAYFYTPFSNLGLCAEGGSSYTFPLLMGRSKASEMLLLNHRMTAEEALRFGVVAGVLKRDEIETKLWPRVLEYGALPIGSVVATKKLLNRFHRDKLHEANDNETSTLSERWKTEEALEAIMKFMTRKSKM